MTDHAANLSVLGLTAQIVAAHVSNNSVPLHGLPLLIQEVYKTLAGVGKQSTPPDRPQPAVSPRKSVFDDHIVCLEDGKKLKMLKRHLKTAYDMTPEQYPGTVGPDGGLPHGSAELRQTSLLARQTERPRYQAQGLKAQGLEGKGPETARPERAGA